MHKAAKELAGPEFVSSRLFQLHVHSLLSDYARLHGLFVRLQDERESSSPEKDRAIAEAAIAATDLLDELFFDLNALTSGADINCFYALDRLKARINKFFEYLDRDRNKNNGAERTADQIVRDVISVSILEPELCPFGDCTTVHDYLLCVGHRLSKLIRERYQERVSDWKDKDLDHTLLLLPIGYTTEPGQQVLHRIGEERGSLDDTPASWVAGRILSAINQFHELHLYDDATDDIKKPHGCRGMLSYSVNTVSFYHSSSRFESMTTANVGASTSGNYLRLIITPKDKVTHRYSDNLLERLLHWLDFDTYSSGGIRIAEVDQVMRETMEQHLAMLGKLLCFMALDRSDCRSENDAETNFEFFLERIV
jgi:hypothetical protein